MVPSFPTSVRLAELLVFPFSFFYERLLLPTCNKKRSGNPHHVLDILFRLERNVPDYRVNFCRRSLEIGVQAKTSCVYCSRDIACFPVNFIDDNDDNEDDDNGNNVTVGRKAASLTTF